MNFSRQDSDYKRLNSDIETLDAQYNLENTDETVSRTVYVYERYADIDNHIDNI